MSLSKGLTPDAVECEALNLHIADLILKTPDIKAENGDVKYTLTLTQQLNLISKIKLSPDISINSTHTNAIWCPTRGALPNRNRTFIPYVMRKTSVSQWLCYFRIILI